MDTNSLVTLISTIGFPIVMCLLFVLGFKYVFDRVVIPMVTKLTEQNESITKSIDNNTYVLNELCEKLEVLFKHDDGR